MNVKTEGIEMPWIVRNIRWIMVTSGALTATMLYGAVAPESALQSTFGRTLTDPLAHTIVRSWSVLIALVGALLIYGAFDPGVRAAAVTIAATSKLAFVALILAEGTGYFPQAAVPAVIDSVWVLVFAWYLFSARASRPSRRAAPDIAAT